MFKNINELSIPYRKLCEQISTLLLQKEFGKGFDPIKNVDKQLPSSNKVIDVDKVIDIITDKSKFIESDVLNYYLPISTQKTHPSIVYNYCSVESFLKIIESKSIYLSNGRIMNDSTELNWIYRVIRDVINEINFGDNKYIEYFMERLFNINSFSYIACFSGPNSGDLLSQWRGYAGDATGLAIGFNPKYFDFRFQIPSSEAANPSFNKGFHHVVYDTSLQKSVLKNILIDSIYKDYPFISKKVYEHCQFSGADKISSLSPIYKNPSFIEEDEWRLIYRPIFWDKNKEKSIYIGDEDKNLQYREQDGKIISFFKYSFSSIFSSDLIPKIILGPKSKVSFRELKYFLNDNGLCQTDILYSKSTYC